jgi:DNA-directed RNA polymerase subunit beta
LLNQFKFTLNEITKDIKEKIEQIELKIKHGEKNIYLNQILNANLLTKNIKKFFTANELSQIMDETNPLSEINHKRKISSFGVGALNKKNAGVNVREINASHFGRICPIETSEGKNAGLILSLTQNAKLNKNGFIEAPFFLRII